MEVVRPTLIFLPGMMCDEALFAPQLDVLSRHWACRVARFDTGDTMADFAASTRALFDAGPVVLIGLSMGGIVAMECLARWPESIAGLVILDSNPLDENEQRQRVRDEQIRRALSGELDSVLIEDMKPLYLAPENRDNEVLLDRVLSMARALGPEVFARQSRALAARPDYSSRLRVWRGPTLLMCGEHDALCPPARHRYMQSLIEGSTLVLIEAAGHLPTLEAPAVVTRHLEGFLAACWHS